MNDLIEQLNPMLVDEQLINAITIKPKYKSDGGTGTTVISIAQIDTIVLNEGYNLQVFYQNFLQIVILVKNID